MAATRTHVVRRRWLLVAAVAATLAFAKDKPRLTADEVLKRNLEALGGEAAIRKQHSLAVIQKVSYGVRTGNINRPSTPAVVAIFRKAPSKYLVVRREEGHEYRAGFDGVDGWEQTDGGKPRSLNDDQMIWMKRAADFYAVLNPSKWYERVTYQQFEDSKEQPAHVLKFVPRSGVPCFRYYDASSFLEIKSQCQAPLGDAGYIVTSYSDHRKVEGVMMPFRSVGESSAHTVGSWLMAEEIFSAQVEDIQVNGEIEDTVFSRPQPSNRKK